MNAYELAEKLDDWQKQTHFNMFIDQATEMLRQQADELIDAGGMISMLREKVSELEYKNELLINRLEVITGKKASEE